VLQDVFPVEWHGRLAVVTLPEHIAVSNSGQIREELLSVLNRGARVLIADMTATQSCDQASTDAVVRAYQRGVLAGAQLRLVVTAPIVRRTLNLSGLDRLISIYPSLEAALAAGAPGENPSRNSSETEARRPGGSSAGTAPARPAVAPAVLLQLMDALHDGVALTDADGLIVLVNRRMEEMFDYDHAALVGQPVEVLVPADLRSGHVRDRTAYQRAPTARPMSTRARLVGLRKDGGTVPVQITLSPVPTATGYFTLAVIRDQNVVGERVDLVSLARSAADAEQHGNTEKLLDSVLGNLYHVGLSLHAAVDQPAAVAKSRITEALLRLDETIHEIRAHVLAKHEQGSPGGG
jgi:anti-anti-sigma factor